MSLRWKIALALFMQAVVVVIAAALFIANQAQKNQLRQTALRLQHDASRMGHEVQRSLEWKAAARRLPAIVAEYGLAQHGVFLLAHGAPPASQALAAVPPEAQVPEFVKANLRPGEPNGFHNQVIADDAGKAMASFQPLQSETSGFVLVVTAPLDSPWNRELAWAILLIAMADLFGAALVWALLAHWLWKPLRKLEHAMEEVSAGNLDLIVDLPSADEFEVVANRFNQMAARVRQIQRQALDANPLTGLPGNNSIRREIEGRMAGGGQFVAIYSDLNNFKAYNDYYSFAQGDEVILFTAQVLKDSVKSAGGGKSMVGHVGGDDFIVVTSPQLADTIAAEIVRRFDEGVAAYYKPEDIARGGIDAKDRQGQMRRFGLLGIALAGVSNGLRPIANFAELAGIAAEVKKRAKQTDASSFYMDKRKS